MKATYPEQRPALLVVLLIVLLGLATACSVEVNNDPLGEPSDDRNPTATAAPATAVPVQPGTTQADVDVAGAGIAVTPLEDRAPVPVDAIPSRQVLTFADPPAFDDALAEAEARRTDDQIVATADVSGCLLLSTWALPHPDELVVGYEFDLGVACVVAVEYRIIFIIDQAGTNANGSWDYTDGLPPIRTEPQMPDR